IIITSLISEVKEMNEMNEKWSNLEEISEYLGVTKDTIRNWIKKTDIPAHKIGRQWKFKLSEVDEWVKSGKSAIE
ncbi:helix-turn-helix domain-containing protein, partial [Heyndrickxia sporothermodurans]